MFLNRLKRDIFFYLSNNIKITNYDHEFEYLFQNLVLASRELKNNNNNNAINIIRRSLKKLKISSNALPSIWWIRILKAADYKNNKDINNLDLVVKETLILN